MGGSVNTFSAVTSYSERMTTLTKPKRGWALETELGGGLAVNVAEGEQLTGAKRKLFRQRMSAGCWRRPTSFNAPYAVRSTHALAGRLVPEERGQNQNTSLGGGVSPRSSPTAKPPVRPAQCPPSTPTLEPCGLSVTTSLLRRPDGVTSNRAITLAESTLPFWHGQLLSA